MVLSCRFETERIFTFGNQTYIREERLQGVRETLIVCAVSRIKVIYLYGQREEIVFLPRSTFILKLQLVE